MKRTQRPISGEPAASDSWLQRRGARWAPALWIVMIGAAGWILTDRLSAVDVDDVLAQLRALPASTLLLGAAASAASYALVGLYEGVAVRLASGRRAALYAFRTALIANPIGRAIGVAVVSGGALRYRMYSSLGLPPREIAAVIILVAMPYLIGVGWLIDASLLLNRNEASRALNITEATVIVLACLGLAKDVGWLVFVARRKCPLHVRGRSIRLPSLKDTLLQTAFGMAQLSSMTAILYVFMPAELGMSWPAFVAIYCIAFVAGQISNVPAGLGVLEAALLLMLPHVPPAKLLGAVLAYRAAFELVPLAVGLILLATFETTHSHGLLRRRRRPPASG